MTPTRAHKRVYTALATQFSPKELLSLSSVVKNTTDFEKLELIKNPNFYIDWDNVPACIQFIVSNGLHARKRKKKQDSSLTFNGEEISIAKAYPLLIDMAIKRGADPTQFSSRRSFTERLRKLKENTQQIVIINIGTDAGFDALYPFLLPKPRPKSFYVQCIYLTIDDASFLKSNINAKAGDVRYFQSQTGLGKFLRKNIDWPVHAKPSARTIIGNIALAGFSNETKRLDFTLTQLIAITQVTNGRRSMVQMQQELVDFGLHLTQSYMDNFAFSYQNQSSDIEYYHELQPTLIRTDSLASVIKRATAPGKSVTECRLRIILEFALDMDLSTRKPEFLRNNGLTEWLEVDLFNHNMSLGIEYDGIFHFDQELYCRANNKTVEEWLAMQARDQLKDTLCAQNNVSLVRFNCYDKPVAKLEKIKFNNTHSKRVIQQALQFIYKRFAGMTRNDAPWQEMLLKLLRSKDDSVVTENSLAVILEKQKLAQLKNMA